MARNHNARVLWVTTQQQFGVKEAYDVPFPIAHAYKRRNSSDPKYRGGILCVVAMPQGDDHTQVI